MLDKLGCVSAIKKKNFVFLFVLLSTCTNFVAANNFNDIRETNMDNRIGKLYFRYGTMGSAKTALLLTQAYNFEERGMKYLCMKPIIDDREQDNVIRSRIGIERRCTSEDCGITETRRSIISSP